MNKFLNVTNHWLIGLLIRKAFEITGKRPDIIANVYNIYKWMDDWFFTQRQFKLIKKAEDRWMLRVCISRSIASSHQQPPCHWTNTGRKIHPTSLMPDATKIIIFKRHDFLISSVTLAKYLHIGDVLH